MDVRLCGTPPKPAIPVFVSPADFDIQFVEVRLTRLVARSCRSTDACFHADDTGRQLLESLDERQPLDLAAERDLAIGSEADDVEDFLADINADRGQCRRGRGVHGLLLRVERSSLVGLPRGKQPVHSIN
jgi:hypothetical protein